MTTAERVEQIAAAIGWPAQTNRIPYAFALQVLQHLHQKGHYVRLDNSGRERWRCTMMGGQVGVADSPDDAILLAVAYYLGIEPWEATDAPRP